MNTYSSRGGVACRDRDWKRPDSRDRRWLWWIRLEFRISCGALRRWKIPAELCTGSRRWRPWQRRNSGGTTPTAIHRSNSKAIYQVEIKRDYFHAEFCFIKEVVDYVSRRRSQARAMSTWKKGLLSSCWPPRTAASSYSYWCSSISGRLRNSFPSVLL